MIIAPFLFLRIVFLLKTCQRFLLITSCSVSIDLRSTAQLYFWTASFQTDPIHAALESDSKRHYVSNLMTFLIVLIPLSDVVQRLTFDCVRNCCLY
jgi:hypothetical protein